MRIILAAFLAVLPLAAQLSPLEEKAPTAPVQHPPSNALDKDDLAFYVRHLYVYGPQITVEVADFEPSEVPGLLKTTVTASYKLARKQHEFFVSEDGKHIVTVRNRNSLGVGVPNIKYRAFLHHCVCGSVNII